MEPRKGFMRVPGVRRSAYAAVLAALLAAGTLTVNPWGWSPFGPARWLAVCVVALGGAALAFWTPLAFWTAAPSARAVPAATGRAGTLRVTRRAGLLWVIFLGWVTVASTVGVDPRLAWLGTPQRHFGALTWLLCFIMWAAGHRLIDDGDARTVVGTATAVCGAVGLWSTAELLGWQPIALSDAGRLVGPLGSAAYLGAAAALLTPVAAGVAADRSWSIRLRVAAGGCAALGFVALIGSGARAAWVGFVLSAGVTGWARRPSRHSFTLRRMAAVGGVAIAAVGLAFATGTASRVSGTLKTGQPGGASRVAEWRVATRVILAHPLTGVGPEGYRIAFGQAVDAGYQRTYGRTPLPDRAHDSLLDVAATTGLPGAATYIGLLAVVGRLIWRGLRLRSPGLVGVGCGLVAYAVNGLFLFPIAELEPGVWLLAGLLSAEVARESELIGIRVPRLSSPALAVAAVAVAVMGVRAVAGDQVMRSALDDQSRPGDAALGARAARLAPANIVIRLAAAELDAATDTIKGVDDGLSQVHAALRWSPLDPPVRDEEANLLVQRSQLSGAATDWKAARTALVALIRSDPRNPAVLLQLGVVDASTGNGASAEGSWRLAASLDPSSAAPDTDLAVLLAREGQPAPARSAALAALARDPGDTEAAGVLAALQPSHGT